MKTKNFIDKIAPIVQKYESEFFNSVSIAQAILETGSGKSELAVNANNIFGIKASAPWTGPVYNKDSKEERNGVARFENSDFRKYGSWEESIKDHASFMASTDYRKEYYIRARTAPSPRVQAQVLTGTYATDSGYGQKLINIMNEYNLYQYDISETKGEGDRTMTKLRIPKEKITLVNTFGRNTNKPKFIVLHYVGAAGQAKANADYFYNVDRQSSAHIFIDKNETWRVGYDDMAMWQVGDGNYSRVGAYNGYVKPGMATNYNTLGIEMCQTVVSGKTVYDWPIDEAVIEQALLQTKAWMDKYNIPFENVIRHYDVSGKMCPGCWRHNNWAKWWEFKARLKKLIDGGQLVDIGESSDYNPQGLATSTPTEYKVPRLPFDKLKVGQAVTLLDDRNAQGKFIWQWYDPHNKKLLRSKRQEELAGTTDEIVEVKEIDPIQHSKFMYRLKN